MTTQRDLAEQHQAGLISRTETATQKALGLWGQVDVNALDASWANVGPQIVATATAAQMANARDSQTYLNQVVRQAGADSADPIIASSFVGIDGSGRGVDSLLFGAVTTTKQAIGSGMGLVNAFQSGASYLAAMMKTALADVGRASDMAASVGKGYTHYVRVVSPGACSRCAILAGKESASRAFLRHPGCHCTAAPETTKDHGIYTTPEQYFESLSKAEQDRVFTKAGAEAIRSGANPIRVVDSRRGMRRAALIKPGGSGRLTAVRIGVHPDGTPVMGYVTGEAATVRGSFGRRNERMGIGVEKAGDRRYSTVKRTRLMPETIVSLTEDPLARRVLLRDAGYLDYPIRDYSNNDWIQQHTKLMQADRAFADSFYRKHGIQLNH
jgi:hypothetical protein